MELSIAKFELLLMKEFERMWKEVAMA